jgi:isoaspartyl peptidase/L-asparaginase-like protein (Ntn-hydrolase superfamily)
MTYSIILHGGAGARPGIDYSRQRAHMAEVIGTGAAMLAGGRQALDVVTEITAELEASGLYVAGRGASPNKAGEVELDASIMHGPDRRAGAVAAMIGVKSPIRTARKVMEETRHVLLAGVGASRFAADQGLDMIEDPAAWYTPADINPKGAKHGTVGCVALDQTGALAAATSTGGVYGKMQGRVGDTPIIGAGTWADDLVAVSCTGVGEYFQRTAAAHDLSARIHHGGADLSAAAAGVMEDIGALGGDGGLIAIDRKGRIVAPYNSKGMKRAAASDTVAPWVRVFEPGEV